MGTISIKIVVRFLDLPMQYANINDIINNNSKDIFAEIFFPCLMIFQSSTEYSVHSTLKNQQVLKTFEGKCPLKNNGIIYVY